MTSILQGRRFHVKQQGLRTSTCQACPVGTAVGLTPRARSAADKERWSQLDRVYVGRCGHAASCSRRVANLESNDRVRASCSRVEGTWFHVKHCLLCPRYADDLSAHLERWDSPRHTRARTNGLALMRTTHGPAGRGRGGSFRRRLSTRSHGAMAAVVVDPSAYRPEWTVRAVPGREA